MQFKNKGQSLVEVLLALAIAAVVLPSLLTGIVASREGKAQQAERLQATALMREAMEAVRNIRDRGWLNVSASGTYHPVNSGGVWSLVLGIENLIGYSRSLVISDVFRDASGAIAASGTLDPSTKKVVAVVSWTTPYPSQVSSTMYFTRFRDNLAHVETTQADFNPGTKVSTVVTNNAGGEVTLGGPGLSDWCSPNLGSNPQVDLPKNGVANAVHAIPGKIFAGTGDNSSGVSYATVEVTNPPVNPPTASVTNTFNGYKTNAMFGENNYAYLATDNNTKEIVIVDITSSTPTEEGVFNAPGNGNGDSIAVSGNTGFMTSGNTLYSFDLSTKLGSRPVVGSLTLVGGGKKIVVQGTLAYVVIDSSTTQLQIIDISNPASMVVIGQALVNGLEGRDVYIKADASRAYLVTANSASESEFFVIDISTKIGNRPTLGTYNTNGMDPKGVTAVSGNKALIVGTGAEEYQAIRLSDEAVPVRCGGINIDSGIHGLASVLEADQDTFSYIITGDATSELKIISGDPGAGASFFGTYESTTFDAGTQTAFNRFSSTGIEPPGSDIKYQVAVATGDGSCTGAAFSFIGPDGSGGSFFTAATNPIPLLSSGSYQNPGRCFRYKVFFTTIDVSYLPIFSDITVNYSP